MTDTAENNATAQQMEYRTEVKQLLDILAHSLYTDREIFLRELLSNASDALNRIQFEMLTNDDVVDADKELAIHLRFDTDAKTITIIDSGIGMNRDEMIENLGTIAHSGAKGFMQSLSEGTSNIEDIIGQFGVGFYSVFMAAEEVTVTSRSYRAEDEAWAWRSVGDSQFSLEPAEKSDRGTTIHIQLKEDAAEFANNWRLEGIVKKHSDYVSFPIYLVTMEEVKKDDDDAAADDTAEDAADDTPPEMEEQQRVVNKQTALWRQSPSSVEASEYVDFYKQLTFDFEDPLLHIHMVADAPVNIRTLLFVGSKRERNMMQSREGNGLKLYSRKVLIQEKAQDLLPEYMRFVEGVVDSEDLPLNVSRETVQSNPVMRQMQRALTNRVLRDLKNMSTSDVDKYTKFWNEFGVFVKEGIASDYANQEPLVELLRLHSTHASSADKWTSLSEYVTRMQPDQNDIYYVIGDDLKSVARSPHLDYFRANELEVIYFTDPIDGFMTSSLREYDGKQLKNVDDAGLDLPKKDEDQKDESNAIAQDKFDSLMARFKEALGDRVTDVQESKQLVSSACRLVSPQDSYDRDIQRIRRMTEEGYEIPKKMLELNRSHPMVVNLSQILDSTPDEAVINHSIEQLFANALLLEGLHDNPAEMVERIQALMETAVSSKAEG